MPNASAYVAAMTPFLGWPPPPPLTRADCARITSQYSSD
jgi:hypothetical protein